MTLTFSTEKPEKECAVLKVKGDVDLDSTHMLKEKILELLDVGNQLIVLDLGGVEFMDSSGLGTLVVSLKAAAEHDSEIRLADLRPAVRKVLDLTGLSRVFIVCDTAEEAVNL